MSQTWENGKNEIFVPFLAHLAKICPSPPNFFLWILPLLDVRYCRKLSSYLISWIQTQENWKEPHFRHDLDPLGQIRAASFFAFCFKKSLSSSVTRYRGQLSSCKISETFEILTQSLEYLVTDGRTDKGTNKRTTVIS